MSILIKGMEMPKCCLDCPCVNGEYGYCQADKEERQIEDPNGRPSWCPIICSIPEGHGRLVDADALLDHIVHNYCDDCDDYDGLRCRACPHDDDVQCIEDAPTIVPAAERSET